MFKMIKKWFTNNSIPEFESMTKKAIDEWAEARGVKLDRRLTKAKMIKQLNNLF